MLTEVALQHRVIPGIAEFARGGLPSPAATDDGNEWVDGPCWLYCGQRWTRVLWIGPARVAGAQAPMYACGACIGALQERVWQSFFNENRPARSTRPSESAEVGQSTSGKRTGKHRGQSRLFRRS
ncbi:hypothetical protein ACIQIG_14135 [Streptomyces bacillaris]|uniref:hypothetical protein n=1 Tax=Streptomyces TaxID=1883 RepID=UPI001152EFB7|nr:hypothetical protein [Streptomyces cavourensis]TQO31067.1 hypothetical protein FHX79_112910 [Streptomyces cavourensis]GGU51795.1 hypothetical protein GCM10010498_06210 [Streptomyces cavourensis]